MTQTHKVPTFIGATLYNDPAHLFSFWYPSDWHIMKVGDSGHQVIIAPGSGSLSTSFSMEVHDLESPSQPDDMEIMHDAIVTGLSQLKNCQVSEQNSFRETHRYGYEFSYTFEHEGETRKRRAILYYRDRWQYSLVCQGRTPQVFDYWLPVWNFIVSTSSAITFDLRSWLAAKSVTS